MPRDGSSIYSYPVGSEGIPDQTIESGKYNNYIADVEQDLNYPRPIVVGGTGASNAEQAMINLKGEIAKQVVTNYDSHLFQSGSFYSATTATGAPVASHAFSGICYKVDDNNLVLEARDGSDTFVPGRPYIREKKAGIWSAWVTDNYVTKFGPTTMEGPLTIDPVTGDAIINLVSDTGTGNYIYGFKNATARWAVVLGNKTAESTGNVGSDFEIYSYADAGTLLDTALKFTRSTGLGVVKGPPTDVLGIATKGFVDTAIANEVTRANGAYQPKDPQMFAGIPQVYSAANYTTVATDAQKMITCWGGGAIAVNINGGLYPVGTCISFHAYSGYISLSNTEAMTWLSPSGGTSGTRTIAQYGVATAVKWVGGNWVISGNGIT
jgi:hypothetical protein